MLNPQAMQFFTIHFKLLKWGPIFSALPWRVATQADACLMDGRGDPYGVMFWQPYSFIKSTCELGGSHNRAGKRPLKT
jgi:hypothetical protein